MEEVLGDDVAETRTFDMDTSSPVAPLAGRVLVDQRFLSNINSNSAVFSAVTGVVDQNINVRPSGFPLNEFTGNDIFICGAFPDKFVRGIGFGNHAALPDEMVAHLLLQHSCIFARDPRFTFLLPPVFRHYNR